MIVTQTIAWNAQKWPGTANAAEYAVFLGSSTTAVTTSTTNSASVSYEDTQVNVFLVRPTDGTNYGPYESIIVGSGQSPCRAWIRSHVRKRVTDRADTANSTLLVMDDEINDFIAQALRDYSLRFPMEKDTTLTLIAGGFPAGARDYQLPADCREIISARYTSFNGLLQLWLKQLPFKGGETTSGTLVGYPKLGVLVPPTGGRFYGGHFDIWEGSIHLDFDPRGNGDQIYIRYKAEIPDILDDVTLLPVKSEDIELLALFTESKVWELIEGKDVRLSRWKENGRRDDLPTEKMSVRIRKIYDLKIQERLTLRPRHLRLVRNS